MYTLSIITKVLFGFSATIIASKYVNDELLKIILSFILAILVHFTFPPNNYINALFFTIYATLLVYLWRELNILEFRGYAVIPPWLPLLIYVAIVVIMD